MGGLFGGGSMPAAQPAPIIQPPPVMPTPDDASVKRAKGRSMAMMLARRGRQSTIETQGAPVDTLA